MVFVPANALTEAWIVALSLAENSILWSTRLDPQRYTSLYSSPAVWRGSVGLHRYRLGTFSFSDPIAA